MLKTVRVWLAESGGLRNFGGQGGRTSSLSKNEPGDSRTPFPGLLGNVDWRSGGERKAEPASVNRSGSANRPDTGLSWSWSRGELTGASPVTPILQIPGLLTGDTRTSHRRYRDFSPEIPGLLTGDTGTSHRRYRDFPPEIPGLLTGDTGTSHRRYQDFSPEIPGLPTGDWDFPPEIPGLLTRDTGTSHRRYRDFPPEIPGLPTGDTRTFHQRYRDFPPKIPGLPTGDTGTSHRRYRDFPPEIPGLPTGDSGTSHRRYRDFPPEILGLPTGDTGTSHRRYRDFPPEILGLPTGDTGTSHRRYQDFQPEIPGLLTGDTGTSHRRYQDFQPEIPGLLTGNTGTSHRRYQDFSPEIPGLPTGNTGTSHRRYQDFPPEIPGLLTGNTGTSHRRYRDFPPEILGLGMLFSFPPPFLFFLFRCCICCWSLSSKARDRLAYVHSRKQDDVTEVLRGCEPKGWPRQRVPFGTDVAGGGRRDGDGLTSRDLKQLGCGRMVGGCRGAGPFGRSGRGGTGRGHFGWGRGEAKPEGTLDSPQQWALSRKARNRLAHALNGNSSSVEGTRMLAFVQEYRQAFPSATDEGVRAAWEAERQRQEWEAERQRQEREAERQRQREHEQYELEMARTQQAQSSTGPDVSTAQKVLGWLKKLAEKADAAFQLRTNAFDPGPRLDPAPEFGGVCWDREGVVRLAVDYFKDAQRIQGSGGTHDNGLCATLASRGCGKSFILDHLCRLYDRQRGDGSAELVLGADLDSRLVPVCISFNGPQDVEVDRHASAKARLLSRLAHRAVLDGAPESWGRFVRQTAEVWDRVDEDVLFEALRLYFEDLGVSEPVVLLAVDEVVKCGDSQAIEIMAICKGLVSSHTAHCRLLVTTFDHHQLIDDHIGPQSPDRQGPPPEKRQKTGPGSQRPITWLPLEPLETDKPSAALFAVGGISKRELHYLVSLSGGHPRSLALLKKRLQNRGTLSVNLVQLEEEWRRSVHKFVEKVSDEVVEELLARTLLGERIEIDGSVEGVSVSSLVSSTVILNALDPQLGQPFVPQLSLLRLHIWSLGDSRSAVKVRVRTLLEMGSDMQHQSFEEFHAIFEELRCWAWHKLGGRPDTTSIQAWLPESRAVPGKDSSGIQLTIPNPCLQMTSRLPKRLSDHQGPLDRCCLADTNQPGFDVLQPMGESLLLHECRYSEPPNPGDATSTRLTPAEDVRRKAVLAASEVDATKATITGRKEVAQDRSVLVVAAHRDGATDLAGLTQSCSEEPDRSRFPRAHADWETFTRVQMPVVILNHWALSSKTITHVYNGNSAGQGGELELEKVKREIEQVKAAKTDSADVGMNGGRA
uniref:Uncharacterized protein n=1 Tax=Chromera velia CCMP2878 TaxID=1169474 RepID=A0A0G4HIT0_9ALVE|eukprot:Cvel_1099.t1-p1 / transcript=Cvel_1099.t1 / gene=Cvel_1099 / organism=Chromera_velia_CCMP2878 / gene_product=Bile salt-activated lipase, putative / transcript_product=Bile salt-activated lipase, putative / location=Cvel_scaffold35:166728-175209(-) / protein_length=1323 / sequence_SO=supercontig / SO=protein_coding / is_pseudo=false